MNMIVSAPLLLENETLRETLRSREAQGVPVAPGVLVGGVVRPAALALLQAAGGLVGMAPKAWPDVVRQLHWELSSSTTLRPLANLMGKGALLPDPANLQGGLRHLGNSLPAVLRQHPLTRLYTILRVDVLLAGTLCVTPESVGVSAWSLSAGDILILAADLPVQETLSTDAAVWTAYYYSPDPCCCKTSLPKAQGAGA